ncbi:hypothetical protein VP01_4862g1 [Puccinia sorghi]|uniref:Uncharacterized protein n=1 Tax=Puccinia sorghi TaxID=27349 RepID=A0A0L6UMA4_9BASI|nr:hypothetical protein VP01_4862g1 [Puccinia sorghi]
MNLNFRKWSDTIERTHKLWDIALKDTKTAYNNVSKDYGIQDNINDVFVQQWKNRDMTKISKIELLKKDKEGIIFNPFLCLKGFDGCNDTPVEPQTKESISNDCLLGKFQSICSGSGTYFRKIIFQTLQKSRGEFKMVIQKVLFTSISNVLEQYLEEIEQKIEIFLDNVIKMSARWLNKPKFHMLVHLPHSIRRFGPESLFAQRNLKVSIVFGVTFSNYESMQAVLSGATLYDHKYKCYFDQSPSITNMKQLPIIQNSMGYKKSTTMSYPLETHKKFESDSKVPIPTNLQQKYHNKKIHQIHSLELDSKNKIKNNAFSSQAFIQTPHVCLCRIFGTVTAQSAQLLCIKPCFLGLLSCQLQAVELVLFAVKPDDLILLIILHRQVENYSGKDDFVAQINSIWAIESSHEFEVTQFKSA